MRPLPQLCETCRGKKRPLSTGERNYYVDTSGGVTQRDSPSGPWYPATGVEDRWSCGRKCAKRRRARLGNRGVESRIAAFTIERVNLQFLDAPKTRRLKRVQFDSRAVFAPDGGAR